MFGTSRKGRAGFSLVELMVAVAIIGILAATALPSFLQYQLRAKTSEVKTNLQAIRHAQMAYMSETGRFATASPSPAAYGGSVAIDFVDTGGPGASFATIGWRPEGRVFFSYAVAAGGLGTHFTADAASDLDADGAPQVWGIVHPDTYGGVAVGEYGCAGVYDPVTGNADRISVVGPCGIQDGRSVF
jgi:type IV pilus assembly protein PilA